jgi:hypothetical protein
MLEMLESAIKGVYASVFYAASKAYMNATRNVIDQEKMAIIIEEVIGEERNGLYFPSFSGVGRSLNYYPINNEQAEDGVAQVAIGLGKYIVDGGEALRFSPRHPNNIVQTSTLDLALKQTQRNLYALGHDDTSDKMAVDDGFNIVKRSINDYAGQPVLDTLVSTYNAANDCLVDNNIGPGRRVVTFANILRDNTFPLANAIDFMLTTGQSEMGRPVEIEFAGNITSTNPKDKSKGNIYWLQIRPIIDRKDMVENSMLQAADQEVILKSNSALGHGMIDSIHNIVYVRPEAFDSARTPEIAREIAAINRQFEERGENYILIGPGRWGTSDNALGIPVKWTDISSARLIVEASLSNYRIEPSQGTHFFQNLTSFGAGYFTINPSIGDGIYNIDKLDSRPATYESPFVRVVNFDSPVRIGIDGRRGIGVVLLPSPPDNHISLSTEK